VTFLNLHTANKVGEGKDSMDRGMNSDKDTDGVVVPDKGVVLASLQCYL